MSKIGEYIKVGSKKSWARAQSGEGYQSRMEKWGMPVNGCGMSFHNESVLKL